MTAPLDAIDALLHVAQNTSPFTDSPPYYTAVRFVRGYPTSDVQLPTVAVHLAGGDAVRRGLGYAERNRYPRLALTVLTQYQTEAARVIEHVLNAWKRDLNCDGEGAYGDVGVGYLHAAGVKSLEHSEASPEEWDVGTARLDVDVTVWLQDQVS